MEKQKRGLVPDSKAIGRNQKRIKLIIEKAFVDPILGPANDFAVSFESQQEVEPGQLLLNFEPVLGNYRHGKGLSEEKTRIALLPFLNASDVPALPNIPDVVITASSE